MKRSSGEELQSRVQRGKARHDNGTGITGPPASSPLPGSIPAHLLPHRKPKNFADRLMRCLLNNVAPDTLWWLGDGKAVALHAKNLKRGDLLDSHFRIKGYNAFIRNCNRWGFSRTNEYDVPDGVKVYKCSLFQRDAPHLMLHMRMDSDVQDVFMRHSGQEDKQKKQGSDGLDQTSGALAPALQPPQNLNPGQGDLNSALLQLASGLSNKHQGAPNAAYSQETANNTATGLSSSYLGANPSPDLAQNIARILRSDSISNAVPTVAPSSAGGNTALVQLVQTVLNPAPAPARAPQASNQPDIPPHVVLLNQIVQLSDLYLAETSSPSSSSANGTIRTVMQLFQIHAKKYNDEQAEQQKQQREQEQRMHASSATSEPLLLELLRNRLQQGSGLVETQTTAQMENPVDLRTASTIYSADPPGQQHTQVSTTTSSGAMNPSDAGAALDQRALLELLALSGSMDGQRIGTGSLAPASDLPPDFPSARGAAPNPQALMQLLAHSAGGGGLGPSGRTDLTGGNRRANQSQVVASSVPAGGSTRDPSTPQEALQRLMSLLGQGGQSGAM